jgi:L-ribulose-5-phosphate 3-epimerase
MPQTEIGVMLGRLSPPEAGRFQCFPRTSWREEIARSREVGLDYIEWIYDDYGLSENPIATEEGTAELNKLTNTFGIGTQAICADWLMDFPLVRCSDEQREQREGVLHELLRRAKRIGASRLVLPFVDASAIRNEEEESIVIRALERALPLSEQTGVEMHLEADFCPADFTRFLARIPHAMVKVNYDTGNSSGLGYIAREEFASYGSRIGGIHIKDRLRKPDGSVATMPLGHGSADFDDVFASIRSIGYSGGFTLQVARGEDGDEVNWVKTTDRLSPPLLDIKRMDLQLTGRVAFIAGSSRGIGKAIAHALLREGCRICITGRDSVALDASSRELRAKSPDGVLAIPGNFTKTSVIGAAFSTVHREWGAPEILVANIGSGSGEPGWRHEEDEWERLFNINFFGSVRLAQAVIPYMQPQGGSILFVASIAALEATLAPLPYSAAKAALLNYSKNLSRVLAADKIRVNCLAPGNVFFPGGTWDQHLKSRGEEVERYISTEVPQKRFGTPEEIANFAAYLVSLRRVFPTIPPPVM